MNIEQFFQSFAWLGLVDNPVLSWLRDTLAGWDRTAAQVAEALGVAR